MTANMFAVSRLAWAIHQALAWGHFAEQARRK